MFNFGFVFSKLFYIIASLVLFFCRIGSLFSLDHFQSGPLGVCHIAAAWGERICPSDVSNWSDLHKPECVHCIDAQIDLSAH